MRTTLVLCLALAAAASPGARAETGTPGAYVGVGLGLVRYDGDCPGCGTQRSTAGKVTLGYRFGVAGIEASWTDYRRPDSEPAGDYHRRKHSVGLGAAWYWPLGISTQAVARVGGANAYLVHPDGNTARWVEATGGLGLQVDLNATLSIALDWDASTSVGGTATHSLLAGLRMRF